ncbi:MAG: hypothetical protein ACRELY_03975 [Polyangiaceae bacterium]
MAPLAERPSEQALPFPLAKQVVRYDRISPFVAGAMTGLAGGGAMVALTDYLMSLPHYRAHYVDSSNAFLSVLASPLARFMPSPWLAITSVAYFVVACSIVTGAFAVLTKRLHKIVPLIFGTMLFFGALWILIDAALVAKLPAIAAKLPFLPVLAGAEALAILSSIQLPLRRDRAMLEVKEEPDRDSLA